MDWVASFMTMMGVYLLGKKAWQGWVFNIVGSVLWSIYAVATDQIPLLTLNLVFLFLDGKGLFEWRIK